MEGQVAVVEVGRVVDHGEDGARVGVLEEAQVLQAAELLREGEGAGEAFVDAHGALGFDGEEEGFAEEGTLEGR